MENKKFLTVMAVLDEETQQALGVIQEAIIEKFGEGTQTMDIPFHITLGSYPVDELERIKDRISVVAQKYQPFHLELVKYNSFGNKVFFMEPRVTKELMELRKYFEYDEAHGYNWVPHVTLWMGDEDKVSSIKEKYCLLDKVISAHVVGIELGKFFPAEKITRIMFKEQE